MKKYIGVDLHKKSIVVCVANKEGQVLGRRTFACAEPALLAEWFAQQAPCLVGKVREDSGHRFAKQPAHPLPRLP